jgi:hypothetical protein
VKFKNAKTFHECKIERIDDDNDDDDGEFF